MTPDRARGTAGAPSAAEPDVLLRLVGDDGAGLDVVPLRHGDLPDATVAGRGFGVVETLRAELTGRHELTVTLRVRPSATPAGETGRRSAPRRDADVRPEELGSAVRLRRIAAYALVRRPGPTPDPEDDLVLLTVLSDRAATAPGAWTMPGGGIDEGEDPVAACVREVWEETGQHVTGLRLLSLTSDHWVGRSPTGRLEDFQPIRLLYAATCPEPTDLVVHDVGGTTEHAEWVTVRDIRDPGFPLVRSWATVLRERL